MDDDRENNTNGKNSNKSSTEDFDKVVKKRTKKMAIIAAVVVVITAVHLSFMEVTTGYLDSILSGDIVAIAPLVLLSWLLIGWYILFRFFRNIP